MILPEKNNSLFCKSESFRNFIIHKFVNLPKYSYLCKQIGEFVILMFFRNRVMIWDDSKNRPNTHKNRYIKARKTFLEKSKNSFSYYNIKERSNI